MKGSKALCIILAVAAGLIALAAGLRGPLARLAAEHWRSQLATTADDRVGLLLGQVAGLGSAGIPVLVDALGSDRERVAKAAAEVLSARLRRWQNLDGAGGVENQAILAAALADRVGQFGPAARVSAAKLAGQILLWLPDSATVDRNRIVAACQQVLRAGEGGQATFSPDVALGKADLWGVGGKKQTIAGPATGEETAGRMAHDDTPRRHGEPLLPEISLAELAPLPGGGLPIDSLPSSVARPPNKPAQHASTDDGPAIQPQVLASPAGARPLDSPRPPRMLSVLPDRAQSLRETKIPAHQPQDPATVRSLSAEEVPAAAKGGVQPMSQAELAAAETRTLMRQLRAQDKSLAAAASDELLRRGFGQVHLDLARRLFDPNAEARKELARLLPGLRSVDATVWLLWLACDEDPEVRLVAITLMATTGDPAVWEQIEKMAKEDPDPRMQERVDRISRRRNERLR